MTVELSEEQVLYFRARRGHLVGPGAGSPREAARAILGAQAQQLPPALLALSLRTKGRPSAAAIMTELFEPPRSLVWTWGQRATLHLYDPAEDWATTVAAREQWGPAGRRGPMPPAAALEKARKVLEGADEPITRAHLMPIAPASYVRKIAEIAEQASMDPKRLAGSRLVWCLALAGHACLGPNAGRERTYAARRDWFPDLPWPVKPSSSLAAATDLARRYLAVYGPATPTDVAHFFGARVAEARTWIAEIEGDLSPVHCGERKGLLALTEDLDDLAAKPPKGATGWPVRLLPLWESMLMAHADKSWTTPNEAERKAVWRKAAYVAAAVLKRGRIVATWTHAKKRGRLVVEVTPLGGWRKSDAAAVRRETRNVAAHFGLDEAEVAMGA
jgi:hypothetical protein